MNHKRPLYLALFLAGLASMVLSACATTGARPQDMSAQAHTQEAESHQHAAEEHAAQYDPSTSRTRRTPAASSEWAPGDSDYNPTAHHQSIAERHQRHARDHAAAAKALESFEEAECGSFAPAVRASCPLLGQVVAVENIQQGVRIRFADNVNIDAAAAHIRCHLAYAATQGREGMHHCPLYLKRVKSEKSGPHTIDLTAGDSETTKALRQRTAKHVVN